MQTLKELCSNRAKPIPHALSHETGRGLLPGRSLLSIPVRSVLVAS